MLPGIVFSDESTARLDEVKYWNIWYASTEYGTNYEGTEEDAGRIDESLFSRENKESMSPVINGEFKAGWITVTHPGGVVTYVYKPIGCTKIQLHGIVKKSIELKIQVFDDDEKFPTIGDESVGYFWYTPDTTPEVEELYRWNGLKYELVSNDKVYLEGSILPITVSIPASITYDFTMNQRLHLMTQMVIAYSHSDLDVVPEITSHRKTDDKEDTTSKSIGTNLNTSGFGVYAHQLQINGSNFGISKRDYIERNRLYVNKIAYTSIPEFQSMSMTRNFQKFCIGAFKNK